MRSPRSRPKPRPKASSASDATGAAQFTFEAIGTRWVIDLYEPTTPTKPSRVDAVATNPEAALAAVHERIARFDRHYSRFRADSLITQMSRTAGDYELPADAKPMFDLYRDLYQISGGAVTPLIGGLLANAGYDANYSLTPRALHRPPAWEEALDYAHPRLTIKQPVLLDVGAIGKGYLVDLIAQVLVAHGFPAFTIDAGGDILHQHTGAPPLRIGLEHPDDHTQAIGLATLTDGSLCGSSPNRRRWREFHHIMDPHTLAPTVGIRAVWTTARSARLADALATALFFVSPAELSTHYAFDYAIVRSDDSLVYSVGFPAEFFTA